MNDGDFMTRLPEEVSSSILSCLDGRTLLACAAVNESWNVMTNRLGPDVWFQACLLDGISVRQGKYQDAREWKKFISAVLPRLRNIEASNSYVTFSRTFKKPIRAIYCYKERIAVAYENIVAVLSTSGEGYYAEYECNVKPSFLMFDDNVLVAASTSGYMSTWSITTKNHLRDYIVHGTLLSLDLLSEYNVLVSSNLNNTSTTSASIYIWGMSRDGGFGEIEMDHGKIYKVILGLNPDIAHAEEDKTCFLFGLTKEYVIAWKLMLGRQSYSVEMWSHMTVPPVPRLQSHVISFPTVGFLFDETELYIMTLSQRSSRSICVWNFRNDTSRDLRNNDRILNLLGVGETYLVYKIRCADYVFDAIRVVDKHNNEERGIAITPRLTSTSEDNTCIVHTPRLDDLNERQDESGVSYAYIMEDECTVCMVKINPRSR